MFNLRHPAILTDLGHVGENGLPLNSAPWFRRELELCQEWGIRLRFSSDRVSLAFDEDQLVPYWVQKETPAIAWEFLRVNGFFRVDSTNSEAFELARRGMPSGTLVYTEEQVAGKGRNGRSWFSSAGKGLYFSVVLRPTQPLHSWPLLTHVASLALVETLTDLSPSLNANSPRLEIDIKWPNDVLISGRKCAGILLESLADGKNNVAVVGVGINVRNGSVPESLEPVATCLDEMYNAIVPRRLLLVRFLQFFQEFYLVFEGGKHEDLLQHWKSRSSMWKDTEIWITEGETCRSAVTCGLNEIGALMVRTPEGSVETVFAGDVSVSRSPKP
jgi:BirA family transcriptional regulator, biotin operon repressor / biotin---[acetyl-CoA-carboxylase] ligase